MASNAPQEPEIAVPIIGGNKRVKKRQFCKACQEIGRKEEEAANRGMDVVRTKLKLGGDKHGKWQKGYCVKHARLAGNSSKDKLFDNAGKIENNHQQKKLPFMVLKKIKMDEVPEASSSSSSSIHSTRR